MLPLTWLTAAAALVVLGVFRTITHNEFALASAAILPVCLVAWSGGFGHGALASTLAAAMWLTSGLLDVPADSARWIVLVNGATRLLTYLFVTYLTARVRTLLLREADLARRDALTGALNRRGFQEIGRIETLRASRYHHPFAVVFIDLDRFKQLNDSRGHESGDRALQAVSHALRSALRATDHVARIGGDEFGILLPEIDHNGALSAGTKLALDVAAALAEFAPASASIGIAWFEQAGTDFEALLKAADGLMYRIKREGAGGVRLQYFHAPPCGVNDNRLPLH
jgi:diguanylate cyclase (GGDEF)-like protein